MSSTVPYIGSKISLVSNSDIRYEGILYTINTQESTIALQSVRCCGTEGRKVPEIPPSSEIYDFIIFRGQDIKDLTVLESANPALSAQLNDPAIMSVNQRPAGAGGAKASGKGTSTGGGGGGSGYGGGSSYSKGTEGGSYGKGTNTGGYGSGKGWSSSGGWNKQDRGNDRSYGNSYSGNGGRSSGGWNNNNNNDGYGSKGSGKQKSTSTETTKGSKGGKTSSKGKEKSSGKTSDKGGKGSKGGKATEKGGGGDKGGNGGRRGGGEGNSSAVAQVTGELVPSVNEAEKSKYHEDFDYEGENKKFEKAKMDVEGEEIEEKLKPLSGYDKGKSFFDNISCEATERAGDAERPKVDRNKARQNDRETFGDTRRPPRPTGGRRGKGGRRGAPRGYRN